MNIHLLSHFYLHTSNSPNVSDSVISLSPVTLCLQTIFSFYFDLLRVAQPQPRAFLSQLICLPSIPTHIASHSKSEPFSFISLLYKNIWCQTQVCESSLAGCFRCSTLVTQDSCGWPTTWLTFVCDQRQFLNLPHRINYCTQALSTCARNNVCSRLLAQV